jgi:hypothetical protein
MHVHRPSAHDLALTGASALQVVEADLRAKWFRRDGESQQRIYWLDGWRGRPFHTSRERATLARQSR